ncbi:MAG: hypothetical protein Q9209_006562 [Squamulea sp. 1 TL-2023]
MARLSSGQKIQKRLVENITLLWTLCETPDRPREHKLDGSLDTNRQLSLAREKQLVDSFSFISASTDDMLRVMAVCIEEDADKNGITIRLASNTGDLSHVTQGFNSIAHTLEAASSRAKSRSDGQQELFRQIVMLDEPRILSRLRSRHAVRSPKTRGKPSLLPLLSKTIHDPSIHERDGVTKNSLTSVQSYSKQLSERFADFEEVRDCDSTKNASLNVLVDVLILISGFDIVSLQTVLESSSLLDPSLKAYLPLALSKLGRYHRTACDLIDAARSSQYTLFRRISVQAIKKPELDMDIIAGHSTGFDQTLQRVTRSSPKYRHTSYNQESVSTARANFQSRVNNCTTPWKVHAEIQLLLFYQQATPLNRPRIIGSSKSACYLCDLFIQRHGQFQVPRTHGRLYDRWIIPEWSINERSTTGYLRSAVDRLNAALEAKIIYILMNERLRASHPAESVLFSREPWSSNPTLSKACSRETIGQTAEPVAVDPTRGPSDPLSNLSSSSLSKPSESVERDRAKAQPCVEERQAELPSLQPVTAVRNVSPGESACCKFTHQNDSLIVQTDVGRIYTSWNVHSMNSTYDLFLPRRACWIQVKCLDSDDPRTQNNGRFDFVDVRSLARSHDHVVEDGAALSSKELALQIRGHTLLIKYSFEDPGDRETSGVINA